MRNSLIATALVVALVAPAAAQKRVDVPKLAFEKLTLSNGAEVILHVDRKLPVVHVNLWYHVGSKNEEKGRTGFAHLFEHMMLQGSKHNPDDYFTFMQRIGARGGRDSNGTTNNDRTNYFSTGPAESLELMLWAHADLLATLADSLTQQKLDNQREVVRNERRQNYDNVPYGHWSIHLVNNLFPEGHPYRWPVIGSHEDLQAATLEDVKTFFRTYYTPNNLSLVISGDFDPAEARKLVEKHFGSIPPGPTLARPRHWIPELDGEKVVEVSDRVPQERVYLAFPGPAMSDEGAEALDLASTILGEGLRSRLGKALVYDSKLCSDATAFYWPSEIAGAFVVIATLRPGSKMADVERTIHRELSRLAGKGPTAAELAAARSRALTSIISGLQNVGAFGGKGDILNHHNTFYGDPAHFVTEIEEIQKLSAGDVRAAAARWLDTPDRLVIRYRPEPASKPSAAVADRAKAPGFGAERAFEAPVVSSDRLPNGLEIHVVERRDLPVVAATLVSRAASIHDPSGKEGLAYLTTLGMKLGAGKRSALAIEEALAELGTALTTDTARERAALGVEVLKPNLAGALALLSDMVLRPSFPSAEIDRERAILVDAIARLEASPNVIARLRDIVIFGREHPYGRPVTGYRRTVSSLTRDDLAAFHARAWKPDAAALLLVGDLSLDEGKRLAAAAFGRWSGQAPPAPAIPPPAPIARGKIVLVDRPGAAQSNVVHVYSAPLRKEDDYYAWRLASDVLGAGASGRLYRNLRQDKGYSYGPSSQVAIYSGAMAWNAYAPVQGDKTRETVAELLAELKGIAGARAVTAKELEDARMAWIRNYPANFATNADVAFRVGDLWGRRWPMTTIAEEPAQLRRATLPQVQAAAARYAVPASAGLLLLGDRDKIEPGLRALGTGDIVHLDVEGNPTGGASATR
jgi:zinc protease